MEKILKPVAHFVRDSKIIDKQPHRHWHYIYKHRRARKLLIDDVSTWQIVAGQVFTVIASVFAGLILDVNKHDIGLVVGAFVVMPGIVDLSASLTGAMAAKINHHIDETPAKPINIAIHAVGFTFIIAVFSGSIVGLFGGMISMLFFNGDLYRIIMLGVASMMTISIIGNPFIAALTVLFKKVKINPDNIVGPIQSSLIDMLAIIVIATYARILV